MSRPRLFCEFPAGLAAVSLRLHGGAQCRPPISRQGSKQGYAEVILATLGLRSGGGAGAYWWAEADDDVRALLRCYPDADMLRRVAEIIRGWTDEEPRALWERLRAERKARVAVSVEEGTAGWMWVVGNTIGNGDSGGFAGRRIGTGDQRRAWTPDECSDRCHRLAEYAIIASANRLINVAGPDLVNTGAGGTTFGGAEFCTPAREVGERFEGMAEAVAGYGILAQWAFRRGEPESGYNAGLLTDREPTPTGGNGARARTCEQEAGLWEPAAEAARGWPPVRITPRIPTADEIADALGTPGDLEGVVIYSDPDYRDTTGYRHSCRDLIPDLARGWDRYGAVVCISEQEPIPELVNYPTMSRGAWHSVEITSGRKGQKRTFSKQKAEFLTMNREPAHRVAVQAALFGGTP